MTIKQTDNSLDCTLRYIIYFWKLIRKISSKNHLKILILSDSNCQLVTNPSEVVLLTIKHDINNGT